MAQVVTHCVPGKFNAMIQVHGHVIEEVAYVIPELNNPLLDQPAIEKMHLVTVAEIESDSPIISQYLKLFKGLGEMGEYTHH